MVNTPTTAEPDPATPKPQLPSLTGLRFLAAISVFAFHAVLTPLFASQAWQMLPARGEVASVFWQSAWLGVSFFFILSGFVLTWSMRPGDRLGSFWRRRALKIWPNHLLTFVAAAVLFVGVFKTPFDGGNAMLNVLLLQAYFPPQEIWTSFNSVSWSLSAEALFYLCFPLLAFLVHKIRPQRLWLWAGVVVTAILLVPLVASALATGPWLPLPQSTHFEFWFTSKFPPVRMLEFLFGIILARIVMTGRRVPLGVGGSAALCVAAYVVAPSFPLSYPQVAVMVVPIGLLIANAAVADVERRRSWASSRVMVWLGEVSFAFYMVHLLVMLYIPYLLGNRSYSTPVALAVVALILAVSLGIAALMYHLVERPIMRRFAYSRRRPRMSTVEAIAEPPFAEAPAEARAPATAGAAQADPAPPAR
ncbi:acyltransferase [Sphaerisporangium sp. TRM90804]|uniref:acyltransferase family protein n=1 Tax=Sphaerisporangium sp. TRM90804 TaxID=3031113 RepID=UPI00244B8547|nr:acyltransferase [Sphaerisporangium sp. TRM90804]MDH2424518.1 acyltransferase [Sphaerisporangium sp. TRM90804]